VLDPGPQKQELKEPAKPKDAFNNFAGHAWGEIKREAGEDSGDASKVHWALTFLAHATLRPVHACMYGASPLPLTMAGNSLLCLASHLTLVEYACMSPLCFAPWGCPPAL
jgi:hypothetical protein